MSARQEKLTEEANRRLVANMYERVLKPLDSSRVDEFFARDYIQHNPLAATGAKGLKDFLDWARARAPNAEHRVKRMFVDGDYVIAHVHVIINPGEAGGARLVGRREDQQAQVSGGFDGVGRMLESHLAEVRIRQGVNAL